MTIQVNPISNTCEIKYDTFDLFFNELPVGALLNSGPVCLGKAITLSFQGETGPYNLIINNELFEDVENGDILLSLLAGTDFDSDTTFTLSSIVDEKGCKNDLSASTTLSFFPITEFDIQVDQEISCFGEADGVLSASIISGDGPFKYKWGNGENTSSISNVVPGEYTLRVTDTNECSFFDTIVVEQPDSLVTTLMIGQNIACFGDSSGMLNAQVSGGTEPYSYAWNSSLADQGAMPENLPSGFYEVTVSDANGCEDQASIILNQPSLLSCQIIVNQEVSCIDEMDGAISAQATGGTGSISFEWNTFDVTSDLNNLDTGFYSVTATNELGCTCSSEVTLTAPDPIISSINITEEISCFGFADGALDVNVLQGDGPFEFEWSNGEPGNSLTNVSSGQYAVTVTDVHNCIIVDSIFIAQPDTLVGEIIITQEIECFGESTGAFEVQASGGTGSYTYEWNAPLAGILAKGVINAPADTYSLTIVDQNGCTDEASIELTEPPLLSCNIQVEQPVSCVYDSNGSISVVTDGGSGNYTYTWNTMETTISINDLDTGYYAVIVTDSLGCTCESDIFLSAPDLVQADLVITEEIYYTRSELTFNPRRRSNLRPIGFNWG